jgi:hypothetical protein
MKRRLLVFIVLALLVYLFVYPYPYFKKITHPEINRTSAVLVVEGSTARVSSRVENAYKKLSTLNQFHKLPIVSRRDNSFDTFSDFKLDARAKSSSPYNPDIANYLKIEEIKRQHDLFLYDVFGVNENGWDSEYHYKDRPVNFSSSFIIHFEPLATQENKTLITVYEDWPQILVGRRFMLSSGHALGPGFGLDIKFVQPTASDKKDLLDFISKLLNSS